MTDRITNLLFCDLKTDEEKTAFFLSGRGYETGVIALSIQNDVAMSYHRCSEYRKEVEALQAEIEKLRAEVERLKSMTAMTMGVGSGDGNLFVHGDYESIKAAQAIVLERDALRGALEEIRIRSSMNLAMNPNPFELTAMLGDIHQIADATLTQGTKA